MNTKAMAAILVAGICAGEAIAAVTITRPAAPLPVYGTTLNFDEAGGPTGGVPTNSWAGIGVASIATGSGSLPNVSVWSIAYGASWLGGGTNLIQGSFGLTVQFSTDLTDFAANYWDTAPTQSFSGGGCRITAFDDGVQVAQLFISNPTFTSAENPRINIAADGGMKFDKIAFEGFSSVGSDSFLDNLSWNVVPAPGAASLLCAAGLVGLRRRRA